MCKTTVTMSRPGRLFAIAATMLFVPGMAHALGLGNLTVYTALNEPLKAEIRFTSLSEKEFRTLDVRLIRQPQHFDGSGLESAAPVLGIGITLVERRRGLYSLLLQSEQPIREPFVRLILEIEWAGGRLVRELITLIDPRELRAPIEEGMPEFPSVAKVGDLGRRDSEASSRADSKSAQTALTDKPHKSTPNTEQAEVLTEKKASAPQPEMPAAQESTVETTVSELDVATIPTPESPPPTPSAQVPIETQRRLIQAEIENWAKQHGLSVDKEPRETVVSDVDVETLPHDDIATKTLEVNLDRPIPNEVPEAASLSTQTSNGGLLKRDLLMVFIGLVVALILVAGGVLIRIYVGRRRALSDHVQRDDRSEDEVESEVASRIEHVSNGDVEDLLAYGDRRSGHGRRQQFISVELERRQGPRRQQDRFAPAFDPVGTVRANTMDETEVYMACGHDENAELLLKEALAKNPGRQDLKVKLLAIYQHRDDPKAFDSLAKELYSNVYPKRTGDDDIGSISEKHVDEHLTTKHAETASDFDHAIEFDMPDSKSAEAKDDDAMGIDSLDSPDDKKKVDAKIFEHEIEALAMTISTNLDAGALHSELTPANENLNDATMENLQVNDFVEIKQVVDRGVDLLEADKGSDQDDTDQPQSTNKPPRKPGKRSGNKNGKSTKSSVPDGGEQEDQPSSQWKEPGTKIDLAKAYIAMGDAERARSILDEVLEEWNSGDGTRG